MGIDAFEITVNLIKMVVIFLLMVQLVPVLVWVERRGSAFIQSRLGPNRIGPLGLTQLLADAVKFLTKENFMPEHAIKVLYLLAPAVALVPAALAFGAIPLSCPIHIEAFNLLGHHLGPYDFEFQSFHFGVGIVFVLGISSLGAYALLLAGWGSANKFSLMGALRASAQMVSYELALGLALVGAILIYGTFDFTEMITQQSAALPIHFLGLHLDIPHCNWGFFYQPLGAILYFCAVFAETNRLPFDLPEAEGELVVGYHTEYGGLKFNLFFIGEYGHMMVGSAILVTFYFGGYLIPGLSVEDVNGAIGHLGLGISLTNIITALLFHIVFFAKVLFFLWIFIWVRWTLPRFRYDQLMDLGWKTMLPWALGNVIVTAIIVAIVRMT
jgi:NADH-quinone oxidoreductase subunit H